MKKETEQEKKDRISKEIWRNAERTKVINIEPVEKFDWGLGEEITEDTVKRKETTFASLVVSSAIKGHLPNANSEVAHKILKKIIEWSKKDELYLARASQIKTEYKEIIEKEFNQEFINSLSIDDLRKIHEQTEFHEVIQNKISLRIDELLEKIISIYGGLASLHNEENFALEEYEKHYKETKENSLLREKILFSWKKRIDIEKEKMDKNFSPEKFNAIFQFCPDEKKEDLFYFFEKKLDEEVTKNQQNYNLLKKFFFKGTKNLKPKIFFMIKEIVNEKEARDFYFSLKEKKEENYFIEDILEKWASLLDKEEAQKNYYKSKSEIEKIFFLNQWKKLVFQGGLDLEEIKEEIDRIEDEKELEIFNKNFSSLVEKEITKNNQAINISNPERLEKYKKLYFLAPNEVTEYRAKINFLKNITTCQEAKIEMKKIENEITNEKGEVLKKELQKRWEEIYEDVIEKEVKEKRITLEQAQKIYFEELFPKNLKKSYEMNFDTLAYKELLTSNEIEDFKKIIILARDGSMAKKEAIKKYFNFIGEDTKKIEEKLLKEKNEEISMLLEKYLKAIKEKQKNKKTNQ